MNIAEIVRENMSLKKEVIDLQSQLNAKSLQEKALKKELSTKSKQYEVLLKKHRELLALPKNSFNLDQFRSNYLVNAFTADTMPKAGGIYAYYNVKTHQLYIGQSVNMANRLKQHFRNGKIKINGHDSEFSSEVGWKFYVLEYIDRDNKKKLDDREAFWIAMGKVATSDKEIINKSSTKEMAKRLQSGESVKDLSVSKSLKQKGQLTNRTRGNNVRM